MDNLKEKREHELSEKLLQQQEEFEQRREKELQELRETPQENLGESETATKEAHLNEMNTLPNNLM